MNTDKNVVPLRISLEDPLAEELIEWLTSRGMPVADARQAVKRTLKRLLPLRGMSLNVKLLPHSDPQQAINLSETLTKGLTEALLPLIRSLAHDRIGLEYRIWRNDHGRLH